LSDEPALCPSAPATPGALLIGVVEETRRVANLATPIPVDEGFVEAARAHGSPERRFRFSIPCVEGSCGHWTGSACGLIGISRGQAVAAGLVAPVSAHVSAGCTDKLPPCGIRPRCRWWRQDGAAACKVCAFVVYEPGTPRSVDGQRASDPGSSSGPGSPSG
jgi:hypothetical protein